MTTSEWSVTEDRHGLLVEVIAVVAAPAALSGLLLDGVYGTDGATTQMLRGFDAVTLLAVAPALLVTVRSERIGAARRHLLVASLLACLGYTYAFDLLGAGFTDLLLLHAALVSATLVAFVLTMRAVSSELGAHAVPHRVHVPAAVLALLAVSLGAMWTYACIAYVVDGTVPAGSSLVESDTVVQLGIVLDLTLLVPLYAAAAVLLWLRRPWGFVLAAVALVSGTLHQASYVVALLFQHAAGVPGAVAADPFEPVIIAAYVVATVLLLRRPHPASPWHRAAHR